MKKFAPFFIVGLFVSIIVGIFITLDSKQNMIVIQKGNVKKLPIKMQINKYQDSDCGMVIEDLAYASQVIAPDGRTWFFHDHGGFVHWLSSKKFKNEATIWVMSRDTHRWIDGKKAFYSRDDITPMGYGFGAYEFNKKDGLIDYETMSLMMLRGETLNNPLIKKSLLSQ